MGFATAVKEIFFGLDELAHPAADEVANDGDSDSDHEHVEPGSEDSTSGEHRSSGADEEVGEHRDRKRDGDRGTTMPDQERKNRNRRAERRRESGDPPFSERGHAELADLELFLHLLL